MPDVQILDSPGTTDIEDSSDVEFADSAYPDSKLVPDMLSERAHRSLDKKVLGRYPWIDDEKADDSIYPRITLLRSLARDYNQLDPRLTYKCESSSVIRRFEDNPWFVSVLNECWRKGSFRTIRLLKILQRTNVPQWKCQELELQVVELSWDRKFEGPAADGLLHTISTYLTQFPRGPPSGYANCAPLVNSSGTGKSRMVDELSKRVITVPMCLRGYGTKGFPPPDDQLRNFFMLCTYDRLAEQQGLREFIYSLLTVTRERLERIKSELFDASMSRNEFDEENYLIKRQERLAIAFRDHLRDGQHFEVTGQYRQEFFEEVIDRAKDSIESIKAGKKEQSSSCCLPKPHKRELRDAGEKLVNFIFPLKGSCWENELRRPIVILAFDEAHQLASDLSSYSVLSELRHVLRELHELPIFTLFISTSASKFNHSPNPNDINDLHPIIATSFDALAYSAEEGVTTLDEVAQDKWMCHLGRPLFAADYDSWGAIGSPDRVENVLTFAEQKLHCYGAVRCANDVETSAKLACLSVRFALEFEFFGSDGRKMEATLVERHLRLCLGAGPGYSRLSTAAESEPFLAKAAAKLIDRLICLRTAVGLVEVCTRWINYKRRGELVATLLVMEARDIGQAKYHWHTGKREWVFIRDFMKALLPPDAYNVLMATLPACHLPDNQSASFGTTFNDAKIWFNHVIRVDRGEMIHVSHLWKYVSRGAMIICPPGYHGIDIVLPVCFKGNALSRDNMTAILIQIKSDKRHPKDSRGPFEFVNPFDAGLFSEEDAPLPVIRMVFALGSEESGITFPVQENSDLAGSFTSYDVWFAGLSPGTFACIGDDLSAYQAVLGSSR